MRYMAAVVWTIFWLVILGIVAWALGLGGVVRSSIAAGHLLDWVTGGLCLIWLLVILKVPWDLYFQTQEVAFELRRSRERGIPIVAGREEYLRALRPRLGWLAVGAHVASAAVVATVTYFSHGTVGYYFAGFYLLSTLFRPAAAGYVYLRRKLQQIAREIRYPREDVVEMRERLNEHKEQLKIVTARLEQHEKTLQAETEAREREDRDLRERLHALGRELETTVSRLTDNQEVIKGIQAFVRLVTASTQPS